MRRRSGRDVRSGCNTAGITWPSREAGSLERRTDCSTNGATHRSPVQE